MISLCAFRRTRSLWKWELASSVVFRWTRCSCPGSHSAGTLWNRLSPTSLSPSRLKASLSKCCRKSPESLLTQLLVHLRNMADPKSVLVMDFHTSLANLHWRYLLSPNAQGMWRLSPDWRKCFLQALLWWERLINRCLHWWCCSRRFEWVDHKSTRTVSSLHVGKVRMVLQFPRHYQLFSSR